MCARRLIVIDRKSDFKFITIRFHQLQINELSSQSYAIELVTVQATAEEGMKFHSLVLERTTFLLINQQGKQEKYMEFCCSFTAETQNEIASEYSETMCKKLVYWSCYIEYRS